MKEVPSSLYASPVSRLHHTPTSWMMPSCPFLDRRATLTTNNEATHRTSVVVVVKREELKSLLFYFFLSSSLHSIPFFIKFSHTSETVSNPETQRLHRGRNIWRQAPFKMQQLGPRMDPSMSSHSRHPVMRNSRVIVVVEGISGAPHGCREKTWLSDTWEGGWHSSWRTQLRVCLTIHCFQRRLSVRFHRFSSANVDNPRASLSGE